MHNRKCDNDVEEIYENVELTNFNECLNKRHPNGSLNYDEYADCKKGLVDELSLEYYQDEEEVEHIDEEISEGPMIIDEEIVIEHENNQQKSSSNKLNAFKTCNIFIIFIGTICF